MVGRDTARPAAPPVRSTGLTALCATPSIQRAG